MHRPIANPHRGWQLAFNVAGDKRRCIHVVQLHANTGWSKAAVKAGSVVEVHQHQAAVVLIVAGAHQCGNFECFQARNHAGGRHLAGRSNQRDAVTHADSNLFGQLDPQHHAEFACLQVAQASGNDFFEIRYFAFLGRVDATNNGRAQKIAVRQHAFASDIGRSTNHFGVGRLDCTDQGLGVVKALLGRQYLDVCNHRQHAIAHLFLKAVHDGQHHDQRCDTKPNASHGQSGNKGNEFVTASMATTAHIAQCNFNIKG